MKKYLQTTWVTFLTFSLLYFCGCIKDVEDKKILSGFKSKLVVASFISPDDSILVVSIKKTRPFFNDTLTENFERVDDALVELSDGNTSVSLTFYNNSYSSIYRVNANLIPIIPGKTYFLTISTPSGMSVKSSCTIPFPVQIETITILDSLVRNFNDGGDTVYTFQAEWHDSIAEAQYYGFEVVSQSIQYRKEPPGDTIKRVSALTNIYPDGLVFKKIEINEKSRGIFKAEKYLNDNEYSFNYDKPIGFNLLIAEKKLYEYSLYSERQTGDFYPSIEIDYDTLPSIDGYPYSEPTTHYTNIEGGYGIFAGYVRVRKKLDL